MLQDLIKDLQSSLKSYSLGLANKNLLVDIPWTMVDGDLNLHRLIFKRNNKLMMIKDGIIKETRWEYLASLNSLILEIGSERVVMNEVLIDDKALILKRDGLNLEFLCFVNSNEMQRLDLAGYLKSLEKTKVSGKPASSIRIKQPKPDKPETQDFILNMMIFLLIIVVSLLFYFA